MAYDMSDPVSGPGDATTKRGLRKMMTRRLNGMMAIRGGYDPLWTEVARFCQPRLSRHLAAYSTGTYNATNMPQVRIQDSTNSKLLDGRAVWASEVLQAGMYSGLTHPARPWFKLTISDDDLKEYQAVKEWLNEVEKRLYRFFAKTNYYTSIKSGYRDIGTFGINAGFMEEHWQYGGVVHPMAVGEYWIGLNEALVADSLYRRIDMTVIQHYRRFLKGRQPRDVLPTRVIEDYDRGNYDAVHPVVHAVEPNDIRDPKRMDARGKAFRSVYWSTVCGDNEALDEQKALLSVEGFRTKPFWAPRWDAYGSDTYSSASPGINALADVRQLQLEKLREQQAIDYIVKPPLRGPATLNNLHVALQPGRITAMAGVDKDSFGPIWQIDHQALGGIQASTAQTREAVDLGFYVDLFNAITNMQGIQPRNIEEIASRNEEKLTRLGPVVERVNQEQLQVAIDRAFDILWHAGALPPVPEELRRMPIEVEFVSVLAQAQRMIGLGAIERTAGYISSLVAGGFPEVGDKWDADQSVDEYADITGISANLIRSDDQVGQLRAGRAQQQQAAAAAEQMAQLAPAAKAGAETAKLLYDSPGTGGAPSIAQRLLGTG